MPALPDTMLRRGYGDPMGWFHDTDYGWRFFPGSVGTQKTIARLREAGWRVTRMACGTYRVEAP